MNPITIQIFNEQAGFKMKIHYLQHVPFEGLAMIGDWIKQRKNCTLSGTKFFEEDYILPNLEEFDFLIVLGGPMSVHEEIEHPWLKSEKAFIKQAIANDKKVLGICLGAQLIAESLGASVSIQKQKEIGWYPVAFKDQALGQAILSGMNFAINAFHWHNECFDIPQGAVHLASSKACGNQGFVFNNHVLGLQFHIEMDREAVKKILTACGDELVVGDFIQSESDIIHKASKFGLNTALYNLLDNFVKADPLQL